MDAWALSFLKAINGTLTDPRSDLPSGSSSLIPGGMDDYDEFLSKYVGNAEKLALILDYDGTLAPLAPHPDLAILPNETGRILERLSNCPDVYVSVISNRNVDNVKKMVGIDGITYAGNNGLEILHPDGTKFVYPLPVEYEEHVRSLLRQLQEEVCHDGAWVEHKGLVRDQLTESLFYVRILVDFCFIWTAAHLPLQCDGQEPSSRAHQTGSRAHRRRWIGLRQQRPLLRLRGKTARSVEQRAGGSLHPKDGLWC